MAISFVAAGTVAAAASGNVTPALPAGVATDDIVLCGCSHGDAVATTTATTGWTLKVGPTAAGTGLMVSWWWYRAIASSVAPVLTHTAGNSIVARTYAFRGAVASGDPFSAAGTPNAITTAGTTATATTITPTAATDALLYLLGGGIAGNTSNPISPATYAAGTPTFAKGGTDTSATTESGLGTNLVYVGFAYGLNAPASATGSRSATLTTAAQSVSTMLALSAAAATAAGPVRHIGRRTF